MEAAQRERTPAFLDGLARARLRSSASSPRGSARRRTSSVLDGDGGACSVTCSNGEGAGIVVPGTGIHLNNMLGEQDLNPLGFHSHPPGRRLPTMMAPTVVLRDGAPELVLGSAGSNRIRSAILQTIVAVVDRGMRRGGRGARAARCTSRTASSTPSRASTPTRWRPTATRIARFRALNLFFGGVQAVERDCATGALSGGGDPRRGGAAVVAVGSADAPPGAPPPLALRGRAHRLRRGLPRPLPRQRTGLLPDARRRARRQRRRHDQLRQRRVRRAAGETAAGRARHRRDR